MDYRTLGRTGLEVGVTGLGMQHLDVPDIIPTVHRAIDHGVNYFDVMIWRAERKTEFGRALKGKRDKVILAGHLSVADSNGQYRKTRDLKECETLFEDQLRRLGTDYVDILHVSYVDEEAEYQEVTRPGNLLDMAQRYRRQGKARFLATSGHVPAITVKMIETGVIDVIMQPINLGTAAAAGTQDMCHFCASRNIGIVVMKAFKGGEYMTREKPFSPVVCLSYSLAQPAVATVAMGVKNVAELDANLRYLTASDNEKDFAAAVAEAQHDMKGTCVYCDHCLPCDAEVDIPAVIRLLVMAEHGITPELKAAYGALTVKASACTECGICAERCPFGVDIIGKMRQAVEVFEA
jgi:predicted aldo/keto reductase-like oxidoreductase